jgi:hypothetical protein
MTQQRTDRAPVPLGSWQEAIHARTKEAAVGADLTGLSDV